MGYSLDLRKRVVGFVEAKSKRLGDFKSVSNVRKIGAGAPICVPSAMALGDDSLIAESFGNTSPSILMRPSRNALSTLKSGSMPSGLRSNA